MKYRTLGRTGLKISEIGFGAWGIGAVMWKGAKDDESLQALNTAIDEGVNFLDTALVYGNGHSEQLVGEVVRARSERIYVATKVPPKNRIWPARGSLEEVFPSDYIVVCVETSLRNLGLERIDLLQLHTWNPEWLKQDEWFETLTELRQQGKMAYFGVSINDHQPDSALELVRSGKIDTVQVIHNIFDQSPEDELFSACLEHSVGVIVRVPFDEGSLTGKITPQTIFPKGDWRHAYFKGDRKRQVHERAKVIESLLGEESNSLPDLALRFCLQPNAVSTVIPGMRSVKHVLANTSASEKPRLSNTMIESLRKHRWVRNFYPEV
ncbi:MAG TPA: aldo/keto reductase [Acidobacteriota bacterium]|nr:aldo/keto reductase [Acidobacteriota bacterium]